MAAPPPPDVQSLIAGLARALRVRDIGFMLIGGQAVLLPGAPRLTDDIDLTLGIGPDQVEIVYRSMRSASVHRTLDWLRSGVGISTEQEILRRAAGGEDPRAVRDMGTGPQVTGLGRDTAFRRIAAASLHPCRAAGDDVVMTCRLSVPAVQPCQLREGSWRTRSAGVGLVCSTPHGWRWTSGIPRRRIVSPSKSNSISTAGSRPITQPS